MVSLRLSAFVAISLALMRTSSSDSVCQEDVGKGVRLLNFCLSHRKDANGQWLTTASALKESEDSRNEMDLRIKRSVTDCGGGRFAVRIEGVLIDNPQDDVNMKLLFHPRAGSNIALTNNRSTAYRLSSSSNHGVVYTERPLKRGELFEIRLDTVSNNYPYNLGIGITTHTPYEAGIPDEGIHTTPGMWLYYHEHFYIDGKRVMNKYGKPLDDSDVFKVGDRVGVRVTDSGILHVLINGEDQGPAANDIPQSVYGVVELRSKAIQVTIV